MAQTAWILEGVSVGDGDEVLNSVADRIIKIQAALPASGDIADQYDLEIVEMHNHGRGYWYGKDPGDAFLLESGLVPWRLTAGAGGAYGNWVQLSDGDEIANPYYDPHQIMVYTASAPGKLYYIQYGTGAAGAQVAVGMTAALPAATLRQSPAEVQIGRVANTSKLWARCNCETDAATIDFVIGLHQYSA